MQKITISACPTLDTLPDSCYNQSNSNRKAQLMTTFDDQFNNDLPGEINDDFSWILPDGETIEDHIPDFYYDEEEMGYDGDFYDSDALTSAGWGEDEAYGCWE